jgi:mono/diheme cytochrome c family protein
MATLVLVLIFVLLGLGVLFVAFSGGPVGARTRLGSQSRASRRLAVAGFVIALIVLGLGVPAAVIALVDHRDSIPQANVSNLTAAEKHGRELFGRRCAACHTLKAANAEAEVGPNLDELRPPKALVLDAIKSGRARGNGQMAANIYEGQDAQDVASFVAKAVGAGK